LDDDEEDFAGVFSLAEEKEEQEDEAAAAYEQEIEDAVEQLTCGPLIDDSAVDLVAEDLKNLVVSDATRGMATSSTNTTAAASSTATTAAGAVENSGDTEDFTEQLEGVDSTSDDESPPFMPKANARSAAGKSTASKKKLEASSTTSQKSKTKSSGKLKGLETSTALQSEPEGEVLFEDEISQLFDYGIDVSNIPGRSSKHKLFPSGPRRELVVNFTPPQNDHSNPVENQLVSHPVLDQIQCAYLIVAMVFL
ncbi:hypothetical protein HYDPIDRAFT_35152, partial [Hydnomerulius pinastri MD-312]